MYMKYTMSVSDESVYIQYIHNKYMIYIFSLEISCTLYVFIYMINLYIMNIDTLVTNRLFLVSW